MTNTNRALRVAERLVDLGEWTTGTALAFVAQAEDMREESLRFWEHALEILEKANQKRQH